MEIKDTSNIRTGWRYTAATGKAIETYSSTGKLITIADRSGRVQTLTHDLPVLNGGDGDASTLDIVTDDTGRQLRFTYGPDKRISKVTDPESGVITYGYDGRSNLISVTFPDGRSRAYHYNEPEHTDGANLPNALTGITDENGGRYATYQYSAAGKANSTGYAGGAGLHTLVYGSNSTTVTDPLGTARTHTFTTILGIAKSTSQSQPGGAGCGASTSATTYDTNGNAASRADFNGNKSCYAYDMARNLETARVEGLAAGKACPSNIAGYTPVANTAERKLLTDWHPTYRLPVKVTEAGRETSTSYDSRGNLASQSVKDTATQAVRSTSITTVYHPIVPGVIEQRIVDGPRTDVVDRTTTDYYLPDESCTGGHFGCRAQVRQITNALGHITRINRYTTHGQPEEIIDPNGLVTTLSYDPRQRLTQRSVGSEVTRYTYDGVGQLVSITSPDGGVMTYAYDAAHRLTALSDALGNKVVYTLDPMGNRIKEDVLDPAGVLAQTRRREFDALNRLWKDVGAQGQTTRYEYDAKGNQKLASGPLQNTYTQTFDALDRLIRINDPAGGQTLQSFDALDRVTQLTDPKGIATPYTLNGFGEVTREVSADLGTIDYTYNQAGALASRKDARNHTLYFSRDALNRLTGVKSNAGGAMRFEATFSYDQGANGLGRLTGLNSYGGGYLRYGYDAQGRLTRQEEGLSNPLVRELTYDSAGRLQTQRYPTGAQLSYSYDAAGRVTGILVNGMPLLSGVVYQPFGPPKGWTWGNGVTYSRSYDTDGRIRQYSLGAENRLLTYDDASRITAMSHGNAGLDRSYGYDVLDRLVVEVDPVGPARWIYDLNSNRTSSQPGTANYAYTYQAGNNRLASVAGPVAKTYSYDAAGNVTGDGRYAYTYDRVGRLASVWQGTIKKAGYWINALGQRTSKVVDGVETKFFYDEAGHLIGEYDADKTLRQETIWLGDIPVATLKPSAATGQVQFYYTYTDHLNTPRVISDTGNKVIWRWDSDAFGTSTANEDPDGDGVKFTYNPRFPGQYFDKETGLHYNYFRDYEPGTGRYVQADPIGLAGGMNLYAYVLSNPLSYTDPLGLDVNVCFYSDAAMGFGHIGFGLPGEVGTQGFYPTSNPLKSPGDVKPDTQKEQQCKLIESPPDKDQCMLSCRARRDANPGNYSLTSRQCTSFVRDCLKECGLPAGNYSGPRPNPFFQGLGGKK
ncbi:MAG: RHS repeat-associated core domain-containing protein [Thiobacillus sp.]|nr:RHS repeat-associated core domain-containing protein [Thiobacillus sp.]